MATDNSIAQQHEAPKHTFLQLLQSLQHVTLDEHGNILNPQDDIDCLIEMAKTLQARLGCIVAGVGLTLVYSQEAAPENDRTYMVHWITHSIGVVIRDLGEFVSILSCNADRKWPIDANLYCPSSILGVLIAIPFLQTNLPVSHKIKINLPMLSLLSRSIEQAIDLESTNLRMFSEQLIIAQKTGEINSEIGGALAYIAEWSGLIEGMSFIGHDADFTLSEITSKAA